MILTTLAGQRLVQHLCPDQTKIQQYVLGNLMGFGTYILSIFVASSSGSSLNEHLLLILAIPHFLLLISLPTQKQGSTWPPKRDLILYLAILLLVLISLTFNWFWPVRDWDALTLYDFRAKVMTLSQDYSPLYGNELNYYLAYPFFTSFVHMIAYIFDFQRPAIYYSLLYGMFGVYLYEFLRLKIPRYIASITTLIIMLTPEIFHHSFVAYTNLPYTIYIVITILILVQYQESKSNSWTWVVALLTAIAVHIRYDDPFWILPIILCLYIVFKQRHLYPLIVTSGVTLLSRLFWLNFKKDLLTGYGQPKSSLDYLSLLSTIDYRLILIRFADVLMFLYKTLWTSFGHLLTITLLGYLYLQNKKNRRVLLTLYATIGLSLLIVIMGTFVTSFYYSKWQIVGGSVRRMMMILYPLTIITSALTIWGKHDS